MFYILAGFLRDKIASSRLGGGVIVSDGNLHVKQILVDLALKARMIEDNAQLQAHLEHAALQVERAVRAKDVLVTEQQLEDRYPWLTVHMLRSYRKRHDGPKYLKFGKHKNSRVYYRIADVERWIIEHEQLEPFVQGLNQ